MELPKKPEKIKFLHKSTEIKQIQIDELRVPRIFNHIKILYLQIEVRLLQMSFAYKLYFREDDTKLFLPFVQMERKQHMFTHTLDIAG
jgi:hypothetical protein